MIISRQLYRERLQRKLDANEPLLFLVKHYGERTKAVLADLLDALAERYRLNRNFCFFLRTLLVELLNNSLRENYFYFLAGCLWEDHLAAMADAGTQNPGSLISFERYIGHLRSSLTFLERVRDFNLKRVQLARMLEEQRKSGSKRLFSPEVDTLVEINRRYKDFARDRENIVRLLVHPTDHEISFTIVNRSFLDELAISRLRSKVIERLHDETKLDLEKIDEIMDESQGGAGLGTYLIKDVLSEKGFNTITESLVISPDPQRKKVSTTLTLDSEELGRFREKKEA